ncbi:hypothetical protein [Salinicoccus carnicancri]|uniref:hypothetical protein n=1 Tax=Salinicoccus carnicancri TaxID=558170 RepID=UPI0002DCDD04|nr:hypothetical protein [Salinicoccus carnicancri]
MKVDLYGSRSFLINILKVKAKLGLELNDAFTGTTIDSQMKKELPIDENRFENFISNHEVLEIKTDFLKRFRKCHSFTKSNILLVDLMHEGKLLIRYKDGTVAKRPVLNRYGYKWENGKELTYDDKISRVEEYVDNFINYLSSYDLVIMNKARIPKYKLDENGKLILKDGIKDINFLNYYAETFEDILLRKKKDIIIIPEYKRVDELQDDYLNAKEYRTFLTENLGRLLVDHTQYI